MLPRRRKPAVPPTFPDYDIELLDLVEDIKKQVGDKDKITDCVKDFWNDPLHILARSDLSDNGDFKELVAAGAFTEYTPKSHQILSIESTLSQIDSGEGRELGLDKKDRQLFELALENAKTKDPNWDNFEKDCVNPARGNPDFLFCLREFVVQWMHSGEPIPTPVKIVAEELIRNEFQTIPNRGRKPSYSIYHERYQLAVCVFAVYQGTDRKYSLYSDSRSSLTVYDLVAEGIGYLQDPQEIKEACRGFDKEIKEIWKTYNP